MRMNRRGCRCSAPLAAAAVALILMMVSASASAAVDSATGGRPSLTAARAAVLGDVATLEALAASDVASLRARDENGWSALHEACRVGRIDAVKYLVQHGADVDERTGAGGIGPTPLGIAVLFLGEDHPVSSYLRGLGASEVGFEWSSMSGTGNRIEDVGGAAAAATSAIGADGSVYEAKSVASSSLWCVDNHQRCGAWADRGECQANPNYMLEHCKRSCEVCDVGLPCVDSDDRCQRWAELGECRNNPDFMTLRCGRSCDACDADLPCVDTDARCQEWAELGDCQNNPDFMVLACRKSCKACRIKRKTYPPCVDKHEKCKEWAEIGECDANPTYMSKNCAKSCIECAPDDLDLGEEQKLPSNEYAAKTRDLIDRTEDYVRDVVFVKPEYRTVRSECKNRHESCSYWAVIGECENNPKYMELHCAAACRTCEMIEFTNRCPIPPNATDALGPGDLNAMFERITAGTNDTSHAHDNVSVLSRPAHPNGTSPDNDNDPDYKIGPWVITVDGFLSPEECDRLIELGGIRGYERSQDVGKRNFDGTYEGHKNEFRTSENAWCNGDCYEDPVARRIMGKIANLTGVPVENSEYLQMLRYEEGQFYRTHHDFIPHHVGRPIGPRILTLYLYLNDVEEGGGTDFPGLNLTVMPKQGTALLWPSVLDEDPNAKDGRTEHQALPVERGMKYGANAWLHLRDYKGPDAAGCA